MWRISCDPENVVQRGLSSFMKRLERCGGGCARSECVALIKVAGTCSDLAVLQSYLQKADSS